MKDGITLDDIKAALKLLEKPVMWYADTAWVERGKAYKIQADENGWYPEYCVFNTEDFREARAELEKRFELRNVREYVRDLRLPPSLINMPVEYFQPIKNIST